jgi:hypothetical protein
MFFTPRLIFDGTEGVGSRFNVLRARTYYRRYRRRRHPFSCFARTDSFLAVPRASGPVFKFCTPRLIFDVNEGIGSRFLVLRARTYIRRYRRRRHTFSCFARPDLFSTVPRESCLVFMFCMPGLVFAGTEEVGAHFHVLRTRNSFRRYRGSRVPFSCFAPGLGFDCTEGVSTRFHALRARTRFPWYRGRRVLFSCFTCPDSVSTVPKASAPVFMPYAPRLGFDGSEGVMSRFHVLRARTHFRRYRGRRVPFSCFARPDSISTAPRASCPVFIFFAPGLVFDGTEGVGSRFQILRARTRFQRYRGLRVPLSSFARPDSFSTLKRASGPVFMFCAPGLGFGGTEGVSTLFHVLRARTPFRRHRGHHVPFSCFSLPD